MSVTAIPTMDADHDHDGVQRTTSSATPSATKALQILESFLEAGPQLGVSQIARTAGLPKSTAFRLLRNLEENGYVERSGRHYMLGRRLFELGSAVQMCRPQGIRETAMPHLAELYVATGKAVHLAVLEETDIVFVEKISGRETVQPDTIVGGRTPAACSALGKAILAFSDRESIRTVLEKGLVRRTRYSHTDPARFLSDLRRANTERIAFDREEAQLGIVTAAAPVMVGGRAIAAVSVSGASTGFNAAAVTTHLRRAASAIAQELVSQAA